MLQTNALIKQLKPKAEEVPRLKQQMEGAMSRIVIQQDQIKKLEERQKRKEAEVADLKRTTQEAVRQVWPPLQRDKPNK